MPKVIDRDTIKVSVLRRIGDGMSFRDACIASGISYGTGLSIRSKDKGFSDRVKSIRNDYMADRLEAILISLSESSEVIEESEKWIEENEIGDKVEKTRKVKKLPPNEKAVSMLANKYAKALTQKEFKHTHELGITIKDRALTVEERLNILENDRQEGQVIDITEFKQVKIEDV